MFFLECTNQWMRWKEGRGRDSYLLAPFSLFPNNLFRSKKLTEVNEAMGGLL